LSRDPIGEEGGVNLYGFVGNDGVNGVDYLGLDCIVLVHRRVFGGPFFHYSVQKLNGCCPDLGKEVSYKEYVGKEKRTQLASKVELLAIEGFTAERTGRLWRPPTPHSLPGYKNGVQRVSVSISAVTYNDTEKTSLNFVNILEGEKEAVQKKWQEVMSLSRSYPYAEQGG
jgi:hypothetical protein